MTAVYKSGMVNALKSVGKTYADMNLGIAQSEMVKSMNAMAESFSATRAIGDSFAATKAITDSFASTKALTQSFATSQMLAESVKTAEAIQKSIAFPEWGHITPIVSNDDDQQTEDAAGETIEENDDN